MPSHLKIAVGPSVHCMFTADVPFDRAWGYKGSCADGAGEPELARRHALVGAVVGPDRTAQ